MGFNSGFKGLMLFIPMCYLIQGIIIIQSNTLFLLLKYTYIQGYMFQLHGFEAIPNRTNAEHVSIVKITNRLTF